VAHGWVRLAQGDALHLGGEKRGVESGARTDFKNRPGRPGERIPAQRLHAGAFTPGEERVITQRKQTAVDRPHHDRVPATDVGEQGATGGWQRTPERRSGRCMPPLGLAYGPYAQQCQASADTDLSATSSQDTTLRSSDADSTDRRQD
jgi:hypothetical protein